MQVMTDDEVRTFVRQNQWATGLRIDANERSIYYDNSECRCIELKYPETPFRVPYFARLLSFLGIGAEEHFDGAVLWITFSDIGSPQLVKSGWKLVEKMRLGFGETRELRAAPGHSFRSDEFVELNAFLLPCFMFGWDAYLLPARGDHFVHISHDEYCAVVVKNTDVFKTLFKQLESVRPVIGKEGTTAKFCRPNTSPDKAN